MDCSSASQNGRRRDREEHRVERRNLGRCQMPRRHIFLVTERTRAQGDEKLSIPGMHAGRASIRFPTTFATPRSESEHQTTPALSSHTGGDDVAG